MNFILDIITFYTIFKINTHNLNSKCPKKVKFIINKKDQMLKFLNFLIKFSIIFLITLLIFGFSTLWYFSIGLPDYKKLSNYQPPISSRVYSENGKLIAEYAIEKRLFVPFDSIPETVINSFLSAEDKISLIIQELMLKEF